MKKAVWEYRTYVLIYMLIILWAFLVESWLPIVMLLLPRLFGGPMHGVMLVTQHLGLAQDVRDYRQSTRTMLLHPLLKFLYWDMNYHIQHHMFPMMPFHSLSDLHKEIKSDCLIPTTGLVGAFREIFTTVYQQYHNPDYTIPRNLPEPV